MNAKRLLTQAYTVVSGRHPVVPIERINKEVFYPSNTTTHFLNLFKHRFMFRSNNDHFRILR
jgi:hypothetical protein